MLQLSWFEIRTPRSALPLPYFRDHAFSSEHLFSTLLHVPSNIVSGISPSLPYVLHLDQHAPAQEVSSCFKGFPAHLTVPDLFSPNTWAIEKPSQHARSGE
ncbi:hypothetical protein HBI82_143760 [Parastagonospora nodorum]|nr:hypothetical protein HBI52_149840 [Parastagonospora nodorum]KAH6007261.1 hypothetical protein HBI82_143760 [Parastagonospora nodorum]